MPSPFPGMNPYLERPGVWEEFHGALVYRLQAQLVRQVPTRYRVRVGERVYLRELPDEWAVPVGLPDVSVTRPPVGPGAAGAVTVAAPARVRLPLPVTDEERVRYLEVIDRDGDQLVTVIELLSRSNKYAGDDHDQYRAKRTRLLLARVNFIELDLLRAGPRAVPGLPPCDYYALVAYGPEVPDAAVWPIRLREPLPAVPVPLRPGDPVPTLDLKAAVDAVYDDTGYARFVYDRPPDPPLSAEDAAWAAGLIPRPAG